ncbi:MAG: type II toxin-antitoxin system RelE/ParE family toxin [Thermodesulfobacteriota bacterium]|nr:type II toxin-antitoxin system RelE/ParE family toxin [Thermodesulfobacteriota bacterium]
MKYTVRLTQQAKKMLAAISDKRIQTKLADRMEKLSQDPAKQGKALLASLSGYRSVRAVGQRYRIIYTINEDVITVLVVALGIRKEKDKKDIYHLARKLIQKNLV